VPLRKKSKCTDRQFSKEIAQILGFRAKNSDLYALALTHKSAINERCDFDYQNNERLEFLGDTVLDAVISELLYKRFPSADEGFLTQMRTKIVNGKSLSDFAKKIGLTHLIHIHPSQNANDKINEDAFEALIGAIYLDRGFKHVKRFVEQKIFIHYVNLNELKHQETNYKSRIIEWSQKHKIGIKFETETEDVDSKYFISYIRIQEKIYGTGRAKSKKAAEQIAAHDAFIKIQNSDETFDN